MLKSNVSNDYLKLRRNVLNYTNEDMNLSLDNYQQVYIAVFDIPSKSGVVEFQTQSLALVFGLNTHLYHGSGAYVHGLERYSEVKKAMQSTLISSYQALPKMKLTNDFDYYDSEYVRVYLKTKKGVYYKELVGNDKEDKFLLALMNHIMEKIIKTGEVKFS